ncbi:hypothetical protein AS026_38310 [Rhizobium altiplani]|uniref:Uncharacterized protein n=1 Tax=Rhizobium altiplani TaxID=1864509 RepID=A0A125Q8P2_9HYPH|nr:hypothetical protein AS026_38310 [Rhizobium altiplani]
MKHHTLDALRSTAGIHTNFQDFSTTREARLVRWAELLEREPDRRLRTLPETECQPPSVRDRMRCADSPMAVAYEDAVFRAEGLKDDSYGEAKRFFELTDWQLHGFVCSCHSGATVRSGIAAKSLRRAARPSPGLWAMLWDALLLR